MPGTERAYDTRCPVLRCVPGARGAVLRYGYAMCGREAYVWSNTAHTSLLLRLLAPQDAARGWGRGQRSDGRKGGRKRRRQKFTNEEEEKKGPGSQTDPDFKDFTDYHVSLLSPYARPTACTAIPLSVLVFLYGYGMSGTNLASQYRANGTGVAYYGALTLCTCCGTSGTNVRLR
eukprot:190633-Rhodomonas_salina.2